MLLSDWGKWLLGAFASRQSLHLSASPPGTHSLELVKVTHFVLQAPLVVPTVTVTHTETVGVVATPVVHVPTARQAQPHPTLDPYRYHPSSNGFEASPASALYKSLSWTQWLLEEQFSPLHIILFLLFTPIPYLLGFWMYKVMGRCAHQLVDYHVHHKEMRRIDRITLRSSWDIGQCFFPDTFGYGPPEKPISLRRIWEAVWGELFRPLLLAIGPAFLQMTVAMQKRLGAGLVSSGRVMLRQLGWCTDRLPGRLEVWFKANGSVRIAVIRGVIGAALCLFDWLILSVGRVTREVRFQRSYKSYLDNGIYDYNEDRRRAYYIAVTQSLDSSVERIMDYDKLVTRYEELQLNYEKAVQEAICNLANKAIGYRNSIIELVKIVNWTRRTVSQTMNYRHNEKLGLRNPAGRIAKSPYTTSLLKFVPVAKNGLHFDTLDNMPARNDVSGHDLRIPTPGRDGALYMAQLMENKLNGYYDVFKEDARAIDRNYPGIELPYYLPHEDPINIANRRLKPILKSEMRFKEQIEDFALDGRLLQYGKEQPKRVVSFGPDEVRLITPRPQRQAPGPCPRG